ncbi:MAG: class I SAM-dependent methyltransferase [Bacteroidota bacterium]|nr:class I SAM-dependent methyltransferase [Bacteroidota bacterium]
MKKEVEYKSGTDTLNVISDAENFNHWMYQTIKPHCSGSILEVGSGIGNISQFFLTDNFEISLSDLSTDYFKILENKFSGYKNLKGLFTLDFAEKELELKYPHLIGQFDTVFALNVLEHVPDHEQSIKNCYLLLKPGGKLVILVPAFQTLFNKFDVALEHQRRYTPKTLKKVMLIPGFKLVHCQYFNAMGILGWFVSGKLMSKNAIPGGQMRLYDQLVPVWKIVDWFLKPVLGLSVICVAQKK